MTQFSKAQIYDFKMYLGDELKAHYVPAVDWDGTPGMYDHVSHKMLYNSGADPFITPSD